MDNRVVAIHQPNFFPWLGYFSKIKHADIFVFLDDVQFIKKGSSYTNRVSINMHGVAKYVTAPIKRKQGVWDINESEFLDDRWRGKFIKQLQTNYAKAPFFKEYKDFIFDLINFRSNNLSAFNINAIREISKLLKFEVNFLLSSELNCESASTQRLIDIILAVKGSEYLSGFGGDNYQEKELYEKNGITLSYSTFKHPVYGQGDNTFVSGLSIIDALFYVGENINDYL